MYGGLAWYDLARDLAQERREVSDHHRLISQLRRVRRDDRKRSREPEAGSEVGRWTLEWVGNGFTGTRVTLRNEATGERRTGRHPFDWDLALGDALHGNGFLA